VKKISFAAILYLLIVVMIMVFNKNLKSQVIQPVGNFDTQIVIKN